LYTISIDDGIDLSILVVYISSRYFGFLFLEEHIMAAKVKAAEKVIGMVPLVGCRCRCGHEWLPRDDEKPRVCPKCKSANWDRPKKFERNPDGTKK